MDYFITIVKDLGFPIFVAVFVLVRLEPALNRLERAIFGMTVMLAKANGMREQDIDKILSKTYKKGIFKKS